MPRTARSVLAVAVACIAVSGCSLSPTSTVTSDDGTEVTVSWADYPGTAYDDSANVLAGPRESEVEPTADAIFTEIEMLLGTAFDLSFSTVGDEGWYPGGGNGYGGDTRYLAYNSASLESDTVPSSPEDWRTIVDLVSSVTVRHGLGPVTLDHETVPPGEDPVAWQKDFTDRFGTDDPDEYWMWLGAASITSQWLWVTILDVDQDPTGKAAEDYGDGEDPGRMVGFSYGATTIPDDERDEFLDELAPFQGLVKPAASDSD